MKWYHVVMNTLIGTNNRQVLKGHKIGLHAVSASHATHNPIDGLVAQAARQGTPFPSFKATVEGLTSLQNIKAISPGTYTIGRIVSRDHEGLQAIETINPADWRQIHARAQGLVDLIADWLALNPGADSYIDCWELCNEPDPPGAAGYLILGKILKKAIEFANDQLPGFDWAILALNSGTPEYDEMLALVDSGVFVYAKAAGNVILTFHEGIFDDGPVDQGMGETLPGSPAAPENSGVLWGRHVWLADLLGGDMLPTIISEGYYQSYGDPGEAARRFEFIDEWASRLWWLHSVQPFTVAPSNQWHSQNYEQAHALALPYMLRVANRSNASHSTPDPDPDPQPTPCFGQPRVQYKAVRVLCPPTPRGLDFGLAAMASTAREFATTVCFSADDACQGMLHRRVVVVINPSDWPDPILPWIELHYPGVLVVQLNASNADDVRKNIASAIRLAEFKARKIVVEEEE